MLVSRFYVVPSLRRLAPSRELTACVPSIPPPSLLIPQMEKLGTLESEVLSHEVVDGRVKVVIRTVPGMKLPRIVRPILREGG